ncbi:FecR family protein [Acetobacter okinawensis]|uniref:FecR family protein n=1 Tax=Acetobacter okinawensis TaxID=1076594 RepID=UPI0020A15F12|nr:FecR domain-containing protein [Acetobacter okinawensis]MCP1214105.1 FecR domain-containing protein [Acetobacter okinawensis]
MVESSGDRLPRRTPRSLALSDEAIEWLALLHSGAASDTDQQGYAAWRQRSPAHEEAAKEAEALFGDIGCTQTAEEYRLTETALAPPAYRQRARRFGRRVFLGSAAAAGVTWGIGPALVATVASFLATYHTGVGERRNIRLSDGSTVWLNTASALSVHFSPQFRRLTLHAGEALFDVVEDRTRPFIVRSGTGEAEAVGTVYALRKDDSTTQVSVQDGTVLVRAGDGRQQVTAGQAVKYRDGIISSPQAIAVSDLFSWTRGKLIFNRKPLAQIAAEIERYRHGRVVVVSDDLKAMEVSGVFDIDDNEALLAALGTATGAQVTHLPFLIIIRPSV